MASTPWHLLTQTASLATHEWSQDTSGIPYGEFSSSATIQCTVQPTSAADALLFQRDTTTQIFDVFLAPTDTTGAAWDCSPKDVMTIGGVAYKIEGKPMDFCSMGVVKKVVVSSDLN